jgi:hypothetical protein
LQPAHDLLAIAGIDDEQDEHVVQNAAALVANERIANLARTEAQNFPRQQAVEKGR